MKLNIWLLLIFSLALGSVYAADPPALDSQVLASPYIAQFVQAQVPQAEEPELSAEQQAVLQRKEFVDRMIELRDRRSELDKQSVQLVQDKYELSSQLNQNELERKRVRIDQKAVTRNIKELERETNIFTKRDKQRKKIEKMQSGN